MSARTLMVAGAVVAAVVLVVLALPTPVPPPVAESWPSGNFAIEGARVFDGTADLGTVNVEVRDGRITAVGGGLAADLPVVDGHGRTLLPGLIDAHTHSWGDALQRALDFGVTLHLDQFSVVEEAQRLAREQDAPLGATDRADLASAGTLVTAPGGHGSQFGIPIPTLERAADADAFVAARLAEGSAWIKLVVEDGSELGISLPTLDAETVAAVVSAAHKRGALAVAHVHSLAGAELVVAAGIDGLVHAVVDQVPGPEFASLLARRGVFVVPTLSVIAALSNRAETGPMPGTGRALASDPDLAPWLRPGERRGLAAGLGYSVPRAFEVAMEAVRVWHAAGVVILAGTDIGNPGTSPGASLHGELELLVAAGLSPAEALAGATAGPASAFRVPGRGRIAVGERADLLLVDASALDDITRTRAIRAVWKSGVADQREQPSAAPRARLGEAPELISDFAVDLSTSLGADWQLATDEAMGGTSVVRTTHVAEGGGVMRVEGELKTGFAFPWAGAMAFFGDPPMEAVDLGERRILEIRARGGAVQLMFLAEGLPRPIVVALEGSTQWLDHRVDLEQVGVPVEAVQAVLLGGTPASDTGLGAFSFEVDEVVLKVGVSLAASAAEE